MKGKMMIRLEAEVEVMPSEIELVKMISNSLRPKDIAEKMGLNTRQVENRIFNLRKKYKVGTPIGLVMLFYRNNLIA